MTVVYFDTSAFSNLWRSKALPDRDLRRVRRRMCSPLFRRRPTMLIGPKLISEMAKLEGKPLFDQELGFLRSLPTVLYARSQFDRMQAEVASFRKGAPPDVFLSAGEVSAILDWASRDANLWRAEREQLARDREIYRLSETDARRAILRDSGDQSALAKRVIAWFARPEERVTDWARTLMRRFRTELDLPVDESAWPAPDSLPTVWAYAGYMVARIYLTNRDGRTIDANDFADWSHYTASAHADEIVTDDTRLLEIMALCPAPKPQPVSFERWAKGILATAG